MMLNTVMTRKLLEHKLAPDFSPPHPLLTFRKRKIKPRLGPDYFLLQLTDCMLLAGLESMSMGDTRKSRKWVILKNCHHLWL